MDERLQAELPRHRSAGRRVNRWIAYWSRWLHVYLSMVGLATILFFGATGLTLNHPEWFFRESTTQHAGTMNPAWLDTGASPPAEWDEYDFSHAVSRLEVAEHLRTEHHLKGMVTDFLAFESECEVTFQGPGYAATARIDRSSGDYTVDVTTNDFISILNDLHKGRQSGAAWSVVIDVSAVLTVLVSVTGFLLIFYLKLRRTSGLVVAGIGLAAIIVMCVIATS